VDRIARIIKLERSAEAKQKVSDADRWEAARLTAEELDGPPRKTLRALGAEIGRSHTHVRRMAAVWRHGQPWRERRTFHALYASAFTLSTLPPSAPSVGPERRGLLRPTRSPRRSTREAVPRKGGEARRRRPARGLRVPEEAIRFADSFRTELRSEGLDIRAGMHAGEVDLQRCDVAGIGVHIASRVMGEAEPSQILVSRTVRDLVAGSDIAFVDVGTRQLKGLGGEWQLFVVSGA
jgi:hypothetical protein